MFTLVDPWTITNIIHGRKRVPVYCTNRLKITTDFKWFPIELWIHSEVSHNVMRRNWTNSKYSVIHQSINRYIRQHFSIFYYCYSWIAEQTSTRGDLQERSIRGSSLATCDFFLWSKSAIENQQIWHDLKDYYEYLFLPFSKTSLKNQ